MDEKMVGFERAIDSIREITLRSKDYYKFVIGLSTTVLLFSVTFIEKISPTPTHKIIISVGWVCLIISIIAGVWLLPKRDWFEAQWNVIKDILSDPDKMLLGIEQDWGKFFARFIIEFYLKDEMSKEPKNEEKIDKLKKQREKPNGMIAKAFFDIMVSKIEKTDRASSPFMHDLSREVKGWKQFFNKQGNVLYLPDISKKLREAITQMEWMEKIMKGFFFAGIILITLSSAVSFLEINVVEVLKGIFVKVGL